MSKQLETDLIALLLTGKGERYFTVADRLKPKHFTDVTLQSIYVAIERVHADQKTFSLSMVESRCDENPNDITLIVYLNNLKAQAPDGLDVIDLADLIINEWYKRTFVEVANDLHKLAKQDLICEELVEAGIAALTEPFERQEGNHIFDMGQLAVEILNAKSEKTTGGIHTGVEFFDKLAAPLLPGQLIVVGGATSSGKSSLCQMLYWKLFSAGIPSFTVQNEMTGRENTIRALSQMSRVNADLVAEPWRMNQMEREETDQAKDNLLSWSVKGMDKGKPTVGEISLQVKKYKRIYGARVLFIDHLQFIKADDFRAKRHDQLAQITSDLKALAKDEEITIILISHLKREDEYRPIKLAKDIKRPNLSALFGSSSIEKDADLVMFVHRPYYFLERRPASSKASHYYDWLADMERWKGKAEIIVAKRRQGKGVGVVEINFEEETTLFYGMYENPDQETFL